MKAGADKGNCGGFTLLESLMAFTALGMLSVMIAESIAGLSRTQVHQADQVRVDEVATRFAREIRKHAGFASKIFTQGSYGDGYLAAMDTSATTLLAGSRLPLLTDRGYFDRDAPGSYEVGNILFIARSADVATLDLGSGDFARISTYAFVLYYLREVENGKLDLAEWTSARIASLGDIREILDPLRKMNVLDELRSKNINFAWDPEQGRVRGLHRIVIGATQPLPPNEKIPANPLRCFPDLLSMRHMHVAANGSLDIPIPAYGNASPGNPYPGGFELKVDGDDNGKLVMFRLVIAGPGKSTTYSEISELVNLRGN